MQEDFKLVADFAPIQLEESGITFLAPGLIGTGVYLSKREHSETRAFTGEQKPLDDALEEAGLEDRHTLVIHAPTPAVPSGGSARGAGDVADDELLLQVPLTENETAFVMYADEAGIVSFHYREATRVEALPSRSFGAPRQDRFRIALRSGQSQAGGSARAFFSDLSGKVIKVLVVGVFPDAVGGAVARAVAAWERKHRPHEGLHGGTWEQLLTEMPKPVGPLARFDRQPSLLFIHGTTSTTAGAFGGLSGQPQLGATLSAAYDGRLAALGHHTMSKSVAENVRGFYAALAAAPGHYTFDVICHSRGGLVARALTDLDDRAMTRLLGEPWQRPAGVSVDIRRIVFVAAPNGGTSLAIPTQISKFVERLANYVNLLPDALGTIAGSALLATAAAVAETALPRVPGLADQAPGSRLLLALAPPANPAQRFFAFQSDFAATGGLIDIVKDGVMDRIFGAETNDLVVPTHGVSQTSSFVVPNARVVQFSGADGVHHTNFFKQPSIVRIAAALRVP